MKYLFVFAHPDDETVACAGTIKSLVEKGDEVVLVLATAGDAGEVMEPAQKQLKKLGSVEKLRRKELQSVTKHLGITDCIILGHKDGQITNLSVWGSLKEDIIAQIELHKPDVVITFDHTGWYYHLDHVGTSIAATLAYQQSIHRPQALLFSHYQPTGMNNKWKYIFRPSPATHQVIIKDTNHKLAAINKHTSQNLTTPREYLQNQKPAAEFYELAMADERGKALFVDHPIFIATN